MTYNHELIGTIGVDDESHGPNKLCIQAGVDTLGMCTITFGSSFSMRIPEEDIDKIRSLLYDVSCKLIGNRRAEDAKQVVKVDENIDKVEKSVDKIEKAVSTMKKNLEKVERTGQQLVDMWAPNDPVNW